MLINKRTFKFSIAAFSLSILSVAVQAIDDSLQPGLQAKLGLASYAGDVNGIGVLGEEDDVIIESLDSEMASYSFFTLLPEIDLAYNFSEAHGLSLGVFSEAVQMNTALEVQPYLNIKYTQFFDSDMKLWVSHAPGFLNVSPVWQDPYLTGEALESSDAQVDLLSVGVDYIFGSPLSFSLSRGEQKIDEERSAQQLSPSLSTEKTDLLNREAQSIEFSASITLPMSDQLFVVLGAKLADVEAEGKAQSFSQSAGDLRGLYIMGRWQIFAQAQAGSNDYDSTHPIFNSERSDDFVSMSVGLRVEELFGFENTEWKAFVHVSERDSNIQFFDQRAEIFGISYSYQF